MARTKQTPLSAKGCNAGQEHDDDGDYSETSETEDEESILQRQRMRRERAARKAAQRAASEARTIATTNTQRAVVPAAKPTWRLTLNKELSLYFYNQTNKKMWRKVKFVANNLEVAELCWQIALTTADGDRLRALNKNDRKKMMWRYHDLYGTQVTHALNRRRSSTQQLGKKACHHQLDEGQMIPAEQLFHVAVRGKHICELPTDTDDPEVNAANQKHNEDNAHFRERFDIYNDVYLGTVLTNKVWSVEDRCYRRISSKVTSADEAEIILQAKNAEKKWIHMWRAKKFGEAKLDRKKARGLVSYSKDNVGACKFGGWDAKGRKLFAKMRHQIKKSRETEWGKLAEEQSCDRLYEKHDMANKEANRKSKRKKGPPKIDLSEAAFGNDSDKEMSDVEFADECQELLDLAAKPAEAGTSTATSGTM
jgi:hypothetical protein